MKKAMKKVAQKAAQKVLSLDDPIDADGRTLCTYHTLRLTVVEVDAICTTHSAVRYKSTSQPAT
jgi:hypothetical protein